MMNVHQLKHAEIPNASTLAFLKIPVAQLPDALLRIIVQHVPVRLELLVIHTDNAYQLKRVNAKVIQSALTTEPVSTTTALIPVRLEDPAARMQFAKPFPTVLYANALPTLQAILVQSATLTSVLLTMIVPWTRPVFQRNVWILVEQQTVEPKPSARWNTTNQVAIVLLDSKAVLTFLVSVLNVELTETVPQMRNVI